MPRLAVTFVIVVTVGMSPGASGLAESATAAEAAAGGLQADFNNDGFADLAVASPASPWAASPARARSTCCTALRRG
jgi:FG-GAP repeat